MIKELRIYLVRKLIEINEKYIFDVRLKKQLKKLFSNQPLQVAFDIGANRGQTIDLLLSINPQCQIYAFEPNPTLYDALLKKYIDRNNVKLFPFGVSDASGEKIFHENVFHATSTFEELDYNSKYLATKAKVLGVEPEKIIKKSYPVQIVRLSDFIVEQGIQDTIDLIKIDTEGHEYYCLKGLLETSHTLPTIRHLQLEMHFDDMYKNPISLQEIRDILQKYHYSETLAIKHGFGDFSDVIFSQT